MKRYIFVLTSVLVSLLAGCSKDDDGSNGNVEAEYYFRFKIDGMHQEYAYGSNQVNLTGSSEYNDNLGVYSINIAGIKDIFESGANTLTIFISDSEGFSPGVKYSNIPGEGDEYPDFAFSMGYFSNEASLYIAGGAGDQQMFGLYKPAFVKFTEIEDTYISGTFSGELLWYDSSSGTNVLMGAVVISEGEFKVPRF